MSRRKFIGWCTVPFLAVVVACAAPFGAKSNETARLGYYAVVSDTGIRVEIAAGRRMARYRVAKQLGKSDDAAFFLRRSWAFTNLFDRATGCFRPKDSRGRWLADFNPAGLSRHFTEGSPLQWSWYVLHQPQWLVENLGGKAAFEKRLDAFFAGTLFPDMRRGASQDITGMIGDYAHGNEPCHHVVGLYRLIGREDKARALELRICRELYRPSPDGLCGNDDCGQMSAWYLRNVMPITLLPEQR